ncbi:Outer membrane protein OprM precursor [compost metagenome]
MKWPSLLLAAMVAATPCAVLAAPSALTLDQALSNARQNQPQLRQAQASVEAAQARTRNSRASLLPQVNLGAGYNAGSGRENLGMVGDSNLSLRASQLIYDFGQRGNRFEASNAQLAAQQQSERETQQQVMLNVRAAFFSAQAAKVLVGVNQEALANQQRHLQQATQFVNAGTRPPIDVVQERANVANAQRQLINAQNDYTTSKARLNQAMGLETGLDFEVATGWMSEVAGEAQSLEHLLQEAEQNRPEIARLAEQQRAQELSLAAQRNAGSPTLTGSAGVGDSGLLLGRPGTSWQANLSMSWPLFSGGSIRAGIDEAEANVAGVKAQVATLRQQVRLELTEAKLSIASQKAAIQAANESVRNAAERLKLAEGRYAAGVGNIIELADAQLALTTARSQVVQEEYRLAVARAQMLKALGRE